MRPPFPDEAVWITPEEMVSKLSPPHSPVLKEHPVGRDDPLQRVPDHHHPEHLACALPPAGSLHLPGPGRQEGGEPTGELTPRVGALGGLA